MHLLQYSLRVFEIHGSTFLISHQLVLREMFLILYHHRVVRSLSQKVLEKSVNHFGVLYSL